MAAAATARKPETRDVGQYDPWNDPIFRQWERDQIEEQERLAAKAKAQVQSGTPEATRLSQMVSGIDARKQNFANQGAVNVQQALWAPLSGNNAPFKVGETFGLKSGGAVTVNADQVISYDKAAAKDIIAIETGILSMKAQNHASVVIGGTDESFKANAWAYAQLHGLDVQGYVPTPEARALAAQLKSQRQGLNNVGEAPFGAPAGVMRGVRPEMHVAVDNTKGDPAVSADAVRQAAYNGGPRAGAPLQQEPVDKHTGAKAPAAAVPVTLNDEQKAQFQKLFAQQVDATNAVELIQRHQKNMVAAQAAAAGKPDDSPEATTARKLAGTYQSAFDNRVNNGMETAVRDLNVNKATRDAFGVETKKALIAHHEAAGKPDGATGDQQRVVAEAAPAATAATHRPTHGGRPNYRAVMPKETANGVITDQGAVRRETGQEVGDPASRIDTRLARRGDLTEDQTVQFNRMFGQQVRAINAEKGIKNMREEMFAAQDAARAKDAPADAAEKAERMTRGYQTRFDRNVEEAMDVAIKAKNSGLGSQAQAAFAKEVKGALAEYHSLSRDEQATRDQATALAPREPASTSTHRRSTRAFGSTNP